MMKKTNYKPRLSFVCPMLGLVTSGNIYALSSCTADSSCLTSINGNTYDNLTNNQSVLDELQTNFGFGSSNFNSGTNLNDLNSTMYTASYMASRFFIQNLTLPVFNISTFSGVHYDVAIGEASTYSSYLNVIHDVEKSYALSNYFISAVNNGYNPITSLDIQSYAYPHANQLTKNSLVAVTPISFLNYLNDTSATVDDIESKFEAYCPARGALFTHDSSNATCLQPFDQLNITGG